MYRTHFSMLRTLLVCQCLGFASAASGAIVHDDFSVRLNPDNTLDGGGGSGFNGGEWYEYPQASAPAWWNQWFFNSPDIEGSKWIEYDLFFDALGFLNDPIVEIAINWSNQIWTDVSTPPTLDAVVNPDDFIVREIIWEGSSFEHISNVGNPILIPDFNPIWVSIDVRILIPGDPDPNDFSSVDVVGEIWHEHVPAAVPEPTSLAIWSLLGLTLGAGWWRRRKRPA